MLKQFNLLTSRNGLGNIVTLLLLAIGSIFGLAEEPIQAAVAGVIPVIFAVSEAIKSKQKPIWSGNWITYVLSAIVLIAPWLSNIFDVVTPLFTALLGGDFSAMWPLLIPIVNEVLVLFKTKPWSPPPVAGAVLMVIIIAALFFSTSTGLMTYEVNEFTGYLLPAAPHDVLLI